MSKAEEILYNLSGCTNDKGDEYYHKHIVLAAMKEAMNDAFDAGIKRALWDYKNPNKEQFIKDFFGE